jgi:hypothetical protein
MKSSFDPLSGTRGTDVVLNVSGVVFRPVGRSYNECGLPPFVGFMRGSEPINRGLHFVGAKLRRL